MTVKKRLLGKLQRAELEFLKSLWGLGTEEEEGYRTGPPGYIVQRNSFLGIDSGAPYTFKNTGSEYSAGIFKQSMGTRNGVKWGCRTGKPGYTA